jgi:hypothetical protein
MKLTPLPLPFAKTKLGLSRRNGTASKARQRFPMSFPLAAQARKTKLRNFYPVRPVDSRAVIYSPFRSTLPGNAMPTAIAGRGQALRYFVYAEDVARGGPIKRAVAFLGSWITFKHNVH